MNPSPGRVARNLGLQNHHWANWPRLMNPPNALAILALGMSDARSPAAAGHELAVGLGALPDRGARFYAVLTKVKGMGTFPIRAFAHLTTAI
jgi:hypothetical protein